jgi:hypothetical protein
MDMKYFNPGARESLNPERSKFMNRRDFIRTFLIGIICVLLGKKANAEKKSEKPLKEAMFWRQVD